MPIIQITAPIINGDLWDPMEEDGTCQSAVDLICGDDMRPPPTRVIIKLTTESGKLVEISIPAAESARATVKIDGRSV